jgi:hypothetical protein
MNQSPRALVVASGIVVVGLGVFALIAFSSVGHAGTPGQQLQAWVKDTGLGPTVGGLQGDDRAIATVVATKRGTAAIHTTCAVLVDDASTATSNLPTPDTGVTQLLARGYQLEYRAGNDCYAAGASGANLLIRSAHERSAGLGLVDQALALVARRTGAAVPTTTTRAPSSGGLFG